MKVTSAPGMGSVFSPFLSNPEDYPSVEETVKVTYGPEDAPYDVPYPVCALVDLPYSMSSRFYTMGYSAVLGAATLRRDAGAENYLSGLDSSPGSPLLYESKATQRAHMTYTLLGGLLGAIVGSAC